MKKIFTNPFYVILFAVICNVLWGSATPAIKLGYELFNIHNDLFTTILFAGVRFTVSGLLVLGYSTAKNKKVPTVQKGSLGGVLLVALVYTVFQYTFFYIGLANVVSASNGTIVNSTSTFMAVIIAHFAYKDDKINLQKILGTIIGFVGVLIVTTSGSVGGFSLLGEGFVMLAALCFVIGSVLIKKFASNVEPAAMTGYNLAIGGAVLIAIGLIGGGHFTVVTGKGLAVLGYLALLSAAAYTLWSALVSYNPVGKVSIFGFIIPVSGSILSAIVFGDDILRFEYLAALILVSAGIIIVNKKKIK